jgi:hypothetical protein
MQQAVGSTVHRVLLGAGDHRDTGGSADRMTGAGGLFDVDPALHRISDGPISGTPAQVALQVLRQVRQLFRCERRCRRHHPGRTEAALKSGRLDEPPLHRV